MMNKNVTHDDFFVHAINEIFSQLKKYSGSSLRILTQQPVDIPRWRNLWHSKQGQDSVLLGSHFFTLNDFLRKELSPFQLADFEIVSPLQLRHLVSQLLEEEGAQTLLKNFSHLFSSGGFVKEITRLYNLFHWHADEKKFYQETLNLENKNPHLLYNFFKHIDKSLAEKNLLSEAEFLRRMQMSASQKTLDETNVDVIFWLFPFALDKKEQQKLIFLNRVKAFQWVVFIKSSQHETAESASENFFSFLQILRQENRLQLVQIPAPPQTNIDLVKVMAANSDDGEATYVLRKTIELLRQNISREKIIILYAKKKMAQSLRLAFFRAGIAIDIPERKKISENEMGSYIARLILLASNFPLVRDELGDFFSSPLLNRRAFSGDDEYIYPSAWQNFIRHRLPEGKHTPSDFCEFIKSRHGTDDGFAQTREKFLPALKILSGKLAGETMLPSGWIEKLRELISEYCIHGASLQNNFQKRFFANLKAVAKFLDDFSKLDKVYAQGLDKNSFVQKFLFDFEKVEVGFLGSSDNPEIENYVPQAEIYCRPLQEGIFSFVDHALICGLNESAFPQPEKGGEILEDKSLQDKLKWFSTVDEKIFFFMQSLSMVQKNILLTYRFTDNKGPSRVIFDLLEKKYPQAEGEQKNYKKQLLEKIPLLMYDVGRIPKWFSLSEQEGDEKNFILTRLPGEITDKAQTKNEPQDDDYFHLSKNKYAASSFDGKNSFYRGKLQNENFFKNEMSISSFETLSQCPQKFLFKTILDLKTTSGVKFSFDVDAIEKGNFFHRLSEKVFLEIKEKLGRGTYANLKNKYSPEQWKNLLEAKLESLNTEIYSGTSMREKIFDHLGEKSISFLENFYHSPEVFLAKKSYCLNSFRPLFIEKKFTNLKLGNFILHGKIDRVDIDEQNKKILLIDYKTGKAVASKSDLQNLQSRWEFFNSAQIAFYMLALAQNADEFFAEEKINLQDYSLSGIYWYVFNEPPVASYPAEDNAGLKYFALAEKSSLAENIFGKNFDYKISLLHELLQKQNFFSLSNDLKNSPKLKLPCEYCEFNAICDGSLLNQNEMFAGVGLAQNFVQAFYGVQNEA